MLGKNYSNLWLLTAVLVATFLAIAFSNASLDYLSYKMDDPFINWVDIKNDFGDGKFQELVYALDSDKNKEIYHYTQFQNDYLTSMLFFDKDCEEQLYLRCRFFQDLSTPLVEKILEKDNVVKNWRIADLSSVNENSIGVVITEEAMKKMGYAQAPSFINHMSWCLSEYVAMDYAVDLPIKDHFKVPVPVLGVVKKLPGNVDMISSTYLYKQYQNDTSYPFNLCTDRCARNLIYFIPAEVDMNKFEETVNDIASAYTSASIIADPNSFYVPEIIPFKDGQFVVFDCYDEQLSYQTWTDINTELMKTYGDKDVHRVYEYDFSEYELPYTSFLSVNFYDLHKLRDFEMYVSENFKVKIEMSQINAKENFNAVSVMGHILSWGIVVFAIVCIILFIVNLLQSYFQKVKRNLGTFKAFGISNRDLISVYVLIMAAIILAAILMSVSVTWLIQGLMHVLGILKDGIFDYLLLWSGKTVVSIAIIILAAIYTVYSVMHKLLKATPGDLIYDRQ